MEMCFGMFGKQQGTQLYRIVFSSIQNIILNRPIRKARFYRFRPLRLYTFHGAMAVAFWVFEVNLSSAGLSTEMHNIALSALAPSWQL